MALIDTTRRAGPFEGNDLTTEFPFAFKLLEPEDLQVVCTDALGTRNLELGVDYTVTGTGDDEGGAIVTTAPLPTGATIWLLGDASFDQRLMLYNQGPFFAHDVMTALDRTVVLCQQLREILDRALIIPIEYGVFDFGEVIAAIVALAPYVDALQALAPYADLLPQILAALDGVDDLAGLLAEAIDARDRAEAAAESAEQYWEFMLRRFTVSTELPSGGEEGDIWFRVTT